MHSTTAYSKIYATRCALEDFTRNFTRITDALHVVPPKLNQAQYVALECVSHLNHALTTLDILNASQRRPKPPSSHTAPGRPTTPGLEPSPKPPA